MAKVTIVIEDGVDEQTQQSTVTVHMESDPPINLEEAQENTDAQVAAVVAAQAINDWIGNENTISTHVEGRSED